MTKLLALILWAMALIVAVFVLITDVWQGVVPLWHFLGAAALDVIGLLVTWAISKRYPNTDWLVWLLLWITTGIIATFALLRLVVLLWREGAPGSNGVTVEQAFTTVAENSLNAVELAPGGKIDGTIPFEVPEGDQGLKLIYQPNWLLDRERVCIDLQ